MELMLMRIAKQANYTIGRLSVKLETPEMKCINGQLVTETQRYLCDTLEPKRRNLKKEKKIPGRTAIPEGRYRVLITKSYRFQCWLPLLLDVPGFSGIRIHAGNTVKDTTGCIIVGRNKLVGQVLESRKWLYELKQKIVEAKAREEPVWLTITCS